MSSNSGPSSNCDNALAKIIVRAITGSKAPVPKYFEMRIPELPLGIGFCSDGTKIDSGNVDSLVRF